MPLKKKIEYFVDYYLFQTLVCVGILLAAGFLLWHFWKPKEETILYVAVIDESLDEEGRVRLQEQLAEELGAGKHQQVLIDDSFYMKDDALEKLEVYLHNGQIDVVIANRDTFETLAGLGFFYDVREMIGDTYQERWCQARGYKDTDEITFEDVETGQGEECPYGVDISGSAMDSLMQYIEEPVLAFAQGSTNQENAQCFLDFIIKASVY